MNLEDTKRLINNVIENEYNHIQADGLEYMAGLDEYNTISNEVIKIQDKLAEILPLEYHQLIEELDCKVWEMVCIELRHYFKQGVVVGTTNLKFLRDTEIMDVI